MAEQIRKTRKMVIKGFYVSTGKGDNFYYGYTV